MAVLQQQVQASADPTLAALADELCAYDVANGGIIIAEQGAIARLVTRVGRREQSGN